MISKKLIYFLLVVVIIISSLYFQKKSKSLFSNSHSIIEEDESEDSLDVDSSPSSNKYNLYTEIKQFMDRQTNYVMNV